MVHGSDGPRAIWRDVVRRFRDFRQLPAATKARADEFHRIATETSRDEDTPEGSEAMDKQTYALLSHAWRVAADPALDDDVAVAELRKLAGTSPEETLRVAEINSREGGRFRDFAVENRRQRLLEAALHRKPVRPPTATEIERMRVVEPFAALPVGEQWARLVAAIPELAELERIASRGAFSVAHYLQEAALSRDERQALIRTCSEHCSQLHQQLDRLLEPSRGSGETLLASRYVYRFLSNYLMNPDRVEIAGQ